MVIGTGYTDRFLTEEEARGIFAEALGTLPVSDKRVLVIIPDSTRSGPIPMVFRVVTDLLRDRVRVLDFLIALGTHKGMTPEEMSRHVGVPCDADGTFAGVHIYNHDFVNDVTKIGTIPAARITDLSGGLTQQDVHVTVNKRLFDYDQIII